jgi:hypothetical protein
MMPTSRAHVTVSWADTASIQAVRVIASKIDLNIIVLLRSLLVGLFEIPETASAVLFREWT